MKTKHYFRASIALLVIFVAVLFSCKKKEEPAVMQNDRIAIEETLGMGTFAGYQHDLSGKAKLVIDTSGNTILRLEDFNMTSGPDVYVYMSKNATFSSGNVIQVKELDGGFTNSNINIDVDDAINHSEYKYVLVYCYQYSALFGTALLE